MNLEQSLFEYYRHYYQDTLGVPDWESLAQARTHEEDDEENRVERLEHLVGALRGRHVLSVGCGTGGFAVVAHRKGADVLGIDPDADAVTIAKGKARASGFDPNVFQVGTAEKLPYASAAFDLVHCYTTLEHVASVEDSLPEMLRVAKPNGVVYIHSPNYLHAYEGHYKLFWPPLLPKPLARLYLAARKRPTQFISTINYLTPRGVRRVAEAAGGIVEDHAEGGAVNTGDGALARIVAQIERLLSIKPHIEVIIRKH